MKPVMRKRSKVQGEVWEWFIIQLLQGEEAEDLPIGEDCIIYFVTFDILVLPLLLLSMVRKKRNLQDLVMKQKSGTSSEGIMLLEFLSFHGRVNHSSKHYTGLWFCYNGTAKEMQTLTGHFLFSLLSY